MAIIPVQAILWFLKTDYIWDICLMCVALDAGISSCVYLWPDSTRVRAPRPTRNIFSVIRFCQGPSMRLQTPLQGLQSVLGGNLHHNFS